LLLISTTKKNDWPAAPNNTWPALRSVALADAAGSPSSGNHEWQLYCKAGTLVHDEKMAIAQHQLSELK